jgi:hypothetical protein
MRRLHRALAVCVTSAGWLTSSPECADAQTTRDLYWAAIGVGAATSGVGLGASASYYASPNLFSLRLTASSAIPDNLFSCETDDITEIALLYGRGSRIQSGWPGWRFFAGGLGVVKRNRTLDNGFTCTDEDAGPVIGVPLEFSMMWAPARAFGVGVTTFVNVNSAASFGGVLMSISAGRLSPPR